MKINNIHRLLATSILTCSLFLCFSCGDAVAHNKEKIAMVQNNPDTPKQVIIKFLNWYKINLNKANNFPFLIKDSADNFMVNTSAFTDYLNFLETSDCISQQYIDDWTVYFNDKAEELKEHPLQSDVPEGFDFDFVLITQEPDLLLNQIDSIIFTPISATDSVALIGLKWPGENTSEYEFEMYKTKAGWQIGYISTPNYD
ncbi:hypothetical protein LX77_03113 [Gelidibacter algens]|uniref:DUF3828 domain-containing protein n=1 Tax=Gelidibacter algens TaxID=49280 RepID=A0A327RWJ8_9FLAO|nr:hypothetical protein [Gelidibacter algens]RAJ20588.1 hypothetical protein LX77_03113 [Gelidibacter algens]